MSEMSGGGGSDISHLGAILFPRYFAEFFLDLDLVYRKPDIHRSNLDRKSTFLLFLPSFLLLDPTFESTKYIQHTPSTLLTD